MAAIQEIHIPADLLTGRQRYEFNKLQKRLRHQVGQAIADYAMIQDGDKVMVCLSGGKDSYAMLDILLGLQHGAPVKFDLVAVNLDQKQPGFPAHVLPEYLSSRGVPFHIIEKDTYSIVKSVVPEGKTTCSLCSRLRRGTLYGFAEQHGMSKIALGHHRDDILETFFLNLFYGGKLKAMPPKLLSDDGKHILIRPLAYCREDDIAEFAEQRGFPLIPCDLCGSQDKSAGSGFASEAPEGDRAGIALHANLQRQAMKEMLRAWQKQHPGRVETIFTALQNAAPSQLLDRALFDFVGLEARREGLAAHSKPTFSSKI